MKFMCHMVFGLWINGYVKQLHCSIGPGWLISGGLAVALRLWQTSGPFVTVLSEILPEMLDFVYLMIIRTLVSTMVSGRMLS